MMNNSLKNRCKVLPGTVIDGKWHRHRYIILKELGFGANGIVYLARSGNQKVALKMSDNSLSVTSEVNVLKSFAKVQGSSLGPSLIDVDDWVREEQTISFYVMEYIEGLDFLQFINKRGRVWANVLILQLLKDLHSIHEQGWVFGDLKPENIIVMGPPPKIRCIDVGGTTIQGRAIKEYTEFYDRGYWGLGTRKAERSYDLFAVGMMMINIEYPNRFNKATGGLDELVQVIKEKSELKKVEIVILKALKGDYQTALEMRTEMLHMINEPTSKNVKRTQKRQATQNNRKKWRWFETISIIVLLSVLYLLYIYGQIF